MPTTDADLESFIAARKEKWRGQFRKDPAQAADLLRRYGKTGVLESAFQGLQQGASHGLADEVERATTGGPAKNHILAQASNPTAYTIAQILGLGLTGGAVRAAGGRVGKMRTTKLRAGGGSVAAGGQKRALENAARAKDIEETWANFPFGKKVDPRVRGFTLDAAHGAALGYGGADPTQDDGALSPERMKRMGISLAASLALAPTATSAGVAATNLPLLWGGRRIGSKKMLEPPGVSRKNPAGFPRQSVEIARSLDESAARSGAQPQRTPAQEKIYKRMQQLENKRVTDPLSGRSVLYRNTKAGSDELQSLNAQLMDEFRGPDGALNIGSVIREAERSDPDRVMRVQAGRNADDLNAPGVGIIARDKAPPLQSDRKNVQQLADLAIEPIARDKIHEARVAERSMASRAILDQYPPPRRVELPRNAPRGRQGDLFDDAPGAEDLAQSRMAAGGRPDPMGDAREAQLVREAMRREALDARAQAARPVREPDFVDQMMEAFTRQDRPALDSWVSTLQAAARKDPTIMDRVRNRVAAQLANNERIDPSLNNTEAMREFINALGMGGNKLKGVPNVLDAARGPARAANNSDRYQDALKRLGNKGDRVRPRHAEALRREMEAFRPGAYTGPWDPRMGKPLVLRGDDQARFIAPWDFYRKGKVTNADVTATGLFSGPLALMADAGVRSAEHKPDWRDRPPPPVIEGQYEEVRREEASPAQPKGPGLIEKLAPATEQNAVLKAIETQDARATAPVGVKEAQRILAQVAEIPLERFGADGRMGPETQTAISRFQKAARIPVTGMLDELTTRRLAQLRDNMLPPEMVAEIRAGLAER